jgi:hypothetical protein
MFFTARPGFGLDSRIRALSFESGDSVLPIRHKTLFDLRLRQGRVIDLWMNVWIEGMEGDADADLRAVRRVGFDGEVAADKTETLLHTD